MANPAVHAKPRRPKRQERLLASALATRLQLMEQRDRRIEQHRAEYGSAERFVARVVQSFPWFTADTS